MVREALLSKIEIPPENVHRMAGEKDPETAAVEYEQELRNFFQAKDLRRVSTWSFSASAKTATRHRSFRAAQR
jgi:hypothetical protein